MSTQDALEFRSVTKAFLGNAPVVKDVDLTVRHGEFLTLLGASGCGKTTMLRMMAGFEHVTSGKVFIDGSDVTDTPTYRRNVGMVFQNLALFPHLSIFDNVAYGLRRRKMSRSALRAMVDRILETVGLSGYQDRAITQLSGGQRQRVALARSLVMEPAVLLLDEPLSALDLKLRRRMQSELKSIQAKNAATFVFVTHDQEEAMSMSDRIAVIREGEIAQIDAPETVYRRPTDDFVATTLGEANLFEAQHQGEDVVVPDFDARLSAGDMPRQDVRVMLRPEHIQVAPDSSDVRHEAEVEQREFAGADVVYKLRHAGRTLTARNPFRPDRVAHPGDRVAIGWSRADAVIVRKTLTDLTIS